MMRKVDRDRERDDRGGGGSATAATAAAFVIAAIAATAAVARPRRRPPRDGAPRRITRHGGVSAMSFAPTAGAPAVLPPPQDLPVLRRQRAQDRLQGRAAAAALRLRARQDRAEPHHRGVGQEAARTRPGDQARAFPRAAALRDPIRIRRSRTRQTCEAVRHAPGGRWLGRPRDPPLTADKRDSLR